MSPLDPVVKAATRVVLVEEVMSAVTLAQAVGIVEPPCRRSEMETRTGRVTGNSLEQHLGILRRWKPWTGHDAAFSGVAVSALAPAIASGR